MKSYVLDSYAVLTHFQNEVPDYLRQKCARLRRLWAPGGSLGPPWHFLFSCSKEDFSSSYRI